MSDAWIPGAGRVRAALDGGPLKGGAPRAVWQALDADPRVLSARSAAQRLDQLDRACHLVWNPLSGEMIQLISIVRAGLSLGMPEGLDHLRPAALGKSSMTADPVRDPGNDALAGVNAEGRVCVQICVVGFAWEPFTSGPMHGRMAILQWLDAWGIARNWPAGPPAPFPHGHAACRSRRLWARGGHFGASQVPDTTAAGPGALDVFRLTGRVPADDSTPTRGRAPAADSTPAADGPLREARGGQGGHPAPDLDLNRVFDGDALGASHAEGIGAHSLTRIG